MISGGRFLEACTTRQRQSCQHGRAQSVERCLCCVVDEAMVAVAAEQAQKRYCSECDYEIEIDVTQYCYACANKKAEAAEQRGVSAGAGNGEGWYRACCRQTARTDES